jgi:hypothetical protein
MLTYVKVLGDFLYEKNIFTTPFFNLLIGYKSPKKTMIQTHVNILFAINFPK